MRYQRLCLLVEHCQVAFCVCSHQVTRIRPGPLSPTRTQQTLQKMREVGYTAFCHADLFDFVPRQRWSWSDEAPEHAFSRLYRFVVGRVQHQQQQAVHSGGQETRGPKPAYKVPDTRTCRGLPVWFRGRRHGNLAAVRFYQEYPIIGLGLRV